MVRWEASKAKKDQALCVILHLLAGALAFPMGPLFALTYRTRGRGGILSGNAMHCLKFREQSVFRESALVRGVCALERGELSDALRWAEDAARAMTFHSILLGFFGV